MGEEAIGCIVAPNVQKAIREANDKGLTKEDVINIFPHGNQIFLVYGK